MIKYLLNFKSAYFSFKYINIFQTYKLLDTNAHFSTPYYTTYFPVIVKVAVYKFNLTSFFFVITYKLHKNSVIFTLKFVCPDFQLKKYLRTDCCRRISICIIEIMFFDRSFLKLIEKSTCLCKL